jgi:hypothetical protein
MFGTPDLWAYSAAVPPSCLTNRPRRWGTASAVNAIAPGCADRGSGACGLGGGRIAQSPLRDPARGYARRAVFAADDSRMITKQLVGERRHHVIAAPSSKCRR